MHQFTKFTDEDHFDINILLKEEQLLKLMKLTGSPAFVQDCKNKVLESKASEDRIFSEAFFTTKI